MKKESELIRYMRKVAKATNKWPVSMKKLHALHMRADAWFRVQ
jgi:hypothetical protein